ncbi:virulence factor SrfC family protein [Niveispirillum irakense]|uniref:virulence factor SrfC family protein n=1 Tax=Niveispirillum irakense TaxID=34011 RepID=UPI00040A660C|nr:virulence factor SrfC family protein [Niveispirillum irakense]
MVREEDQQLATTCHTLADAAREALEWSANSTRRLGPLRAGIDRSLKRHLMEADRLARAAERPMSAAVFGASQAGKSFLIGKFITPPHRTALALFGSGAEQERLDFLTQVNPQGGKETTGLVTRFSLRPEEVPAGFPVVLRLVREVDLVKILVNSFVFDLSALPDDPDLLSPAAMEAHLARLEGMAGAVALPGFRFEDVLDLQDYLRGFTPTHPLVQNRELADGYWSALEGLLPRLSADARLEALSPLWGRLPEFNDLFRELRGALELLGHATTVYAPLSAIRDTSAGILHVDRIYELAEMTGPGSRMVTICTAPGRTVMLRQPVITALTAELRITLDRAPWPFLEHTDLLDFPGARSREGSSPDRCLRRTAERPGQEKPPRELCFLRGKVAVLFDNYVTELDLNTMMLCVPDGNLEIRKLPELVEGWIARTHGDTPQKRAGRPTSLLLCMTKCDRIFDLSAGGNLEQQIENRFRTNFDEFPGWTTEWHPGRAFTNTFLLRNPKALEQHGQFRYGGVAAAGTVRDEEGFTPDFETRILPAFRRAMGESPLVRRHVANPAAAVDALLGLNDGGTTALAEALAPVCQPDLKYRQIRPQAQALANALLELLEGWYEREDVEERVRQRQERAMGAIRAFAAAGRAVGLLVHELGVEEAPLRRAYMQFLRRDRVADTGEVSPPSSGGGDFGLDLAELGLAPPPAAGARAKSPALRFGERAVARWLERLADKTEDMAVSVRTGLPGPALQTFAEEMGIAARRLGLMEAIDRHTEKVTAYRQPPGPTAAAVALGSAMLINDFVADCGRSLLASTATDPAQVADARAAFTRPPRVDPGGRPDLPEAEDELSQMRRRYGTQWARAFLAMTRENAGSAGGQLVDIAQNAKLGRILSSLRV